jgi:hypothetical protein
MDEGCLPCDSTWWAGSYRFRARGLGVGIARLQTFDHWRAAPEQPHEAQS